MRKAFTLVEMMVVVAVMMLLTGIGAVSLNKFNNGQKLDGQKEELIADLKLAKNMAKTNQLPVGITGSLKYVQVILNSGIGISATTVLSEGSNGNYFSKENNSISASSTFGFSVENGRLTDDTGKLTSTPVCLTLYLSSDTTTRKYVYIDTSGLVYEKNSCP
jgi:prepilin-type N-terminal cleavage/methylation domain-containing protein